MISLLFATLPLVSSMTLEEKVGQTLMVHFQGEEVNEDAKTVVQELHVGGIQYYNWANGLTNPQQIQDLSNSLQQLATIPLFIAVDQEGGRVARLKEGFTQFSGMPSLGIMNDPGFTESYAIAVSRECKAVGINWNFAPVADIASRPDAIMKARSAGDTAEKVLSVIEPLLSGYQKEKLITSLKHFPGHGDVSVDSHFDLPILTKSEAELRGNELLPYQKLAAKADTIMTAHILVPALDPTNCATLSPLILQELLRKEFQFKGVIISDSLVMEGILKQCSSIEEAAVLAFNAGCDIIMLGGKQLIGAQKKELTVADIKKIAARMIEAVENGEISEERLNESVQRILDLKSRYELATTLAPTEEDIKAYVATPEHQVFRLTFFDILEQAKAAVEERKRRGEVFSPPSPEDLARCKEELERLNTLCPKPPPGEPGEWGKKMAKYLLPREIS